MNPKLRLFLKIAGLLVVIAVIHLIVLWSCIPAGEKEKSGDGTENTAKEGENPADDGQRGESGDPSKGENASRKTVVSASAPAPYDFKKTVKLDPKTEKFSKRCRSGIIIDLNTRRVLWMKDPDRPVAIASLTKMMTALLVMEKMDAEPDKFNWTTKITITDVVKNVEPSILGLKPGEVYNLGELMQAMLINSHNDAAAQLAEVVSGSVPKFVEKMNQRAWELGLKSARFNSPNGLPQGKKRLNSTASAADVARIGEMLLRYPNAMKVCGSTTATLHTERKLWTHNRLLLNSRRGRRVKGMDGFKTGYTSAAGCCLAFSVNRNNRRIIGCVTGCSSAADRDNLVRQLIEWAYQVKP